MATRALVIDDDELALEALHGQLRSFGIGEVVTVADGARARRMIEAEPRFDLIVCDLLLPGHDAVELLGCIARHQSRADIILVSALDPGILRSVAVLARERGLRVIGALRKPVRMEALRDLVASSGEPVAPLPERLHPGDLDVRRALSRRDIRAIGQPILRPSDDAITSVEVLAHWTDPRLGPVPSIQLAHAADAQGLSTPLALRMVESALQFNGECASAGLSLPVSVNLGSKAVYDRDLPRLIGRILVSASIAPHLLTVEIPEGPALDHADVLDVLSRLRIHGVGVALDNFGLGQASALRLQRLPLTALKIDRSIVRCLPSSGVADAVAGFAVRLARDLGIVATAVGVESIEQAEALEALGCDSLQGQWICAPMEPALLAGWIRTRAVRALENVA